MFPGPWFNIKITLTSIGNPIVEIRRSYDRLISTMGFPILVRRRLYIESGPWFLQDIRDNGRLSHSRPHSLTDRPIPGWQTLHYWPVFNSLRPRRNRRHFADDSFTWIFLNENISISNKISLKFIPKSSITNIPALVQIMAWRLPGDKPLSEPMMVSLTTHICVTRPQWVNGGIHGLLIFVAGQLLVTQYRSAVIKWIGITIHSELVCHVLVLRMETKWCFAKECKAGKYIDSKLKPSHRNGYIEISIKYLQTALSVYRHFIAHKMFAYSKPYNEIGFKRCVEHQQINHIYFLYHVLCHIASNSFATICRCICSWLNCLGIYHCTYIYIYMILQNSIKWHGMTSKLHRI